MKVITIKQFFNLTGELCSSEAIFQGVSVDSRNLKPGDIYFALPGERVDGHQFIGLAASKGAVAAVVSYDYSGEGFGLPLIKREDVLKTLQDLASKILEERGSRVVAVTGSHGKTTTKEFLTTLIKEKYTASSTLGNYNGQIGLPLSILKSDGAEEILVLEMGMSQAGEIAKLVQIAPPEVAVIGNVDRAHAEFFDSIESISNAKAEILSSSKTRLGILNRDLTFYEQVESKGECRKCSFSTSNRDADFLLSYEKGISSILHKGNTVFTGRVPVPGVFNLENFLAAAIAANAMGVSWEEIGRASKKLNLPERRFQELQKGEILFIDDAYNASSPLAMRAALSSIPAPTHQGRKLALLGEMLELGKFSEDAHREVGEYALDKVELLFCYGEGCKSIVDLWKAKGRDAQLFLKQDELVEALHEILIPGDVVLVKGSRGCALEKVIEKF
ncbi:MAG: UDP-N-acetylmuramoyl-tripeptide--D-alanyl-D-alanine ligase [Chlamydiales bacterium]